MSGDLEFVGARMVIRAQQARLWNVALADIRAEIADLGVHEPTLEITGKAGGPTADFLRFVEASPVGEKIEHVTEGMVATGDGELRLHLSLPLTHIVDTTVDGRYRFVDNSLVFDADAPPLADINGELRFSGEHLEAKKIRATMLGSPMTLDIGTADGKAAIKASGSVTAAGLRQRYALPWLDHLSGSSPWSGTVRVRGRSAEVRIESSLQGIASSLPAPFNKPAAEAMPLLFERRPSAATATKRSPVDKAGVMRDTVSASLGTALRVQLLRRHDADTPVIERGAIGVGRAEPRLPDRGVLLAVQQSRLDLDFWRRLTANGKGEAGGGARDPILTQFDVQTDELLAGGQTLHAAHVSGNRDASGRWRLNVGSREAVGTLEWDNQDSGHITGHLSQLLLADSDAGTSAAQETTDSLPALDLTIDRCQIGQADLGQLKLRAENRQGVWAAAFEMHNDGGDLSGTGQWRLGPTQTETRLDFALAAKNVDRLLSRAGHPNTIKRGTADLTGSLSWAGSPLAFDYPSLSGKLKLEAAGGQFNKLDPGVGRLLGVFSLQSLPRRITLDFRDIFSSGFAFDSIKGNFAVSHGVMTTQDLLIDGPAAKVMMNGSVDLAAETQDLKVRVQPEVGQSVATGVLLVNPVAGAATWALNKLFGNPLDKAFAFDYAVSGHWADPKVEKLAVQGPANEAKPAAGASQ